MERNHIFNAKLLLTNDMIEPDPILITSKFPPSNTHAISKDKYGNVVSYYGDNKWDFTGYDLTEKSRVLSFTHWAKNDDTLQIRNIISEMKQLIFIYIWYRRGSKFKVKCISDLGHILNIFGRYCLDTSLTLKEFLSSEKHLSICLFTLKPSTMYAARRFLLAFNKVDTKLNPFCIYDLTSLPSLSKIINNYRNNLKQVSPIPPRIYLKYIDIINNKILTIHSNIDKLLLFITRAKQYNDTVKLMTSNQRYIKQNTSENFKKLIRKNEADIFFEDFNSNKNIHGTIFLLNSIFFTCRLAIQMYTGMRLGEATVLISDCADTYIKNDNKYYIIKGRTSKLAEHETQWITNEIGFKSVTIASRISRLIAESTNDIQKLTNPIPLFIRVSYLGILHSPPKRRSENFLIAELNSFDELRKTDWLKIEILDEDINELRNTDPFRAWESESNLSIGNHWPLQTHQFRRTLALYCARSGMVSLTSLKRQLQHLSIQMTLYYSKGSSFSKNLLATEKNHFANEFQEAQSYSQALDYLQLFIKPSNKFHGVQGKIINKIASIHIDRKKTIKQFKIGQLEYRETCLDGCTSLAPCNQRAIRSIVGCIDCKNAVLQRDKLENVIVAQRNLVNNLDIDSLEFRTESNDLSILEKTLKNILSK
ncbi:TPA: hypothetical protein U2I49_000574 [Citrobacter koseri]|nr:hypothetical protein [Citrobacter koseri]HEM6876819.1 hypothetical protein [Citrobacter koseri]HEM8002390.1 hypothetical protein [Citrobacter koseri]